jgi:glycosyltransferase involved in cell wall biosynthesis
MTTSVGLLTYGLERTPGGIGRYTRELDGALRAAGIPVTTVRAGGHGTADGAARLPGAGRLPALLTLGQAQLAVVARRRHLDVVHDPSGNAPISLVRTRRVVTIHDAIPYIHPEASTLLDRLIYRLWLPWIVRRVDAVITVSEHSKADLLRFLPIRPERITVIPLGIGAAFRPQKPSEIAPILDRLGIGAPYILSVGSIEVRKNLPRLVEAFSRLRAEDPSLHLVLTGARKLRQSSVAEDIRRLGLEGAVHLTGFVEDADLPALYAGATLFVLPSLYEGFGLPVLEAMACGTPVVASRSSSLPEIAGEAAVLVDPFDVDAIAAGMRQVLTSPDLAARLRTAGLARAETFTWRQTAEATIGVYERVLGRPGALSETRA